MQRVVTCRENGCGAQIKITGYAHKYCAKCAHKRKIESQNRSKEISGGAHKCKTCDKLIPIDKVYCGSKSHPKSCAYREWIKENSPYLKKPVMKERKSYPRDTSCDGSGYF